MLNDKNIDILECIVINFIYILLLIIDLNIPLKHEVHGHFQSYTTVY